MRKNRDRRAETVLGVCPHDTLKRYSKNQIKLGGAVQLSNPLLYCIQISMPVTLNLSKVPLLQNLELCCGVSWHEVKRGKGHGASCKTFFAMSYSIFVGTLELLSFIVSADHRSCIYLNCVQEEQRVIEAKIRMRRQELQDEEERMQKRLEMSSSSRVMTQADVEYRDVVGSSPAGLPSIGLVSMSIFYILKVWFWWCNMTIFFFHISIFSLPCRR